MMENMHMEKIHIYDLKNYTDDMEEFEKFSVRAVIVRDGKIAAQKGRAGDYKILGGGIDKGETCTDAVLREVQEESGLLVIPESIRPIGEIEEKRRDRFEPDKIFHCHSMFFFCDVKAEMTSPHMTASEIEKGYHLVWASPEEIISGNQEFLNQPWIFRDTEFVQMYAEGKFDRKQTAEG